VPPPHVGGYKEGRIQIYDQKKEGVPIGIRIKRKIKIKIKRKIEI